jgi:hypothetical protein
VYEYIDLIAAYANDDNAVHSSPFSSSCASLSPDAKDASFVDLF